MNNIHINEKLYSDLLITEDKSVAQVICDTEVLKEIYELLRTYIMGAGTYTNEVKMKYYSHLTEQIYEVMSRNREARRLYRWLFNRDFSDNDKVESSYIKNQSQLLMELRVLAQKWDDDETDGELITEAIMAAFSITRNISSNAS